MICKFCDLCAKAINPHRNPQFNVFKSLDEMPRIVEVCDECAIKASEAILALQDLPKEVTVPIKLEEEVDEPGDSDD